MDSEKSYIWCVGWLACLMLMDCVIQCLMDTQLFLFVCFFSCLMDGWMDGYTRALGAGEGAASRPCKPSIYDNFGKTESYLPALSSLPSFLWLVRWLVRPGWFVGRLVDGMVSLDGWVDALGLGEGATQRLPGQFAEVTSFVSYSFRVPASPAVG